VTKVTVYGLVIPNVVKNAKTNDIVLHDFRLDTVYTISLNHISPMHLSCLKASIDGVWLWLCRLARTCKYACPSKIGQP